MQRGRGALADRRVCGFHRGNGARLERINWLGDPPLEGITQSNGVMVNYLYDLDDIENSYGVYAGARAITPSAVRRLAPAGSRELVPPGN
jgi:malonyl-CoA decarboxylase